MRHWSALRLRLYDDTVVVMQLDKTKTLGCGFQEYQDTSRKHFTSQYAGQMSLPLFI